MLVALVSLSLSSCGFYLSGDAIKFTVGHDWLVVHGYYHLQRQATYQLSFVYRNVCSGSATARAACTRDTINQMEVRGAVQNLSKYMIITAMDDARDAFRDQMHFIAWRAAPDEDPNWCLTLDTWEVVVDRYTWSRRNLSSSDCNQGQPFTGF